MENIDQLENQAVNAAITYNWQLAIDLNKKVIKLDKKNLSAYLRLGFATLQLQNYDESINYYRKALKIQPNNNVAKENIDRITILKSRSTKKNKKAFISLDPNLFLEIPGKTKSVSLVNLGQKNILAQLSVGQEVFLKTRKRKVEVRTKDNEYIGNLPDDLSRRLLVFLKAKSKYRAFIKEAILSKITIFISEEKKGTKVHHYLSFPQNIQSQIEQMQSEKEVEDESDVETEVDLEKLADTLATEDKEYLPYRPETEEDESEE